MRGIVWFRRDLRLHDNPALKAACEACSEIIPLFIFDEPTTGLHFDDINRLLAAFRALIDNGGSLLVIEHNLDVIKTADHVIDLGPEGGVGGGEIVAVGTPEDIAKNEASHTGRYLSALVS